eukprot:10947094-Karenia_brevis.AAC.1
MKCPQRGWLLDVISFIAAISACEKGVQWELVAPSPQEMPKKGLVAGRDQLQCGHLSVRGGWAVAA